MPHLVSAANARIQPRGAVLSGSARAVAACVPNKHRRRPLTTSPNAKDTPRENETDGIGNAPAKAPHASMKITPRRLCLLGGLAATATCVPFVNSSFAAVDAKKQSPPPPKFDAFPDGLRLLKIRSGEGKKSCSLSFQ